MDLEIFDLGLVDFKSTYLMQKEIFAQVKTGLITSALILCQHYPVITLGRKASKKNILASGKELETKGISVYEIERGGDVTYHGPGQLVAYPIFNLSLFKRDIHLFLRQLEEIVINFLSDFGIKGERYNGMTGVWIGKQKIASIGIAIRHWITFHGLSLNIKKDDLANFNLIRPCGLDIEMTALESVLNKVIEINQVKKCFREKFIEFWRSILEVSPQRLREIEIIGG